MALPQNHRLSTIGLLLALGILCISVAVLWSDRQSAWERAAQTAQNVRVTLDTDIASTVRLYDFALVGVAEALRTPGFELMSPALRHRLLFSRAPAADYLGSLLVLDAHGDIIYDSASDVPRRANFSDRAYFQVHQLDPAVGLFISEPFASRLRNGDPSMAFSRRIFNPDASFGGVVVATMRLQAFYSRFNRIDLGEGSALTLMSDDGTLLMRTPFDPRDIGRRIGRSLIVQLVEKRDSGTVVAPGVTDGVSRLFSYGRVGNLPLIMVVGVSTSEVMEAWWQKTLLFAPLTLVLCAAVATLSFLFQRELIRRRRAEGELAALAETDVLTGLPNRRYFDQAYRSAWMRTLTQGSLLSLLFIDADNFKAYNDQYGHAEGDELLKTLASAIARSVRTPKDFVARYGGEEFIVILPDTSGEEAVLIANRILDAVVECAVPQSSSPRGVATVSIGVATIRPSVGGTASLLLKQADLALYRAKHLGRDRVASYVS